MLVLAACAGSQEKAATVRPTDVGVEPIEVVTAWWDARNSFDYERMAALMSGTAFDNPFASRAEVEAARLLKRLVTPLECEIGAESSSLGTFVACDVSVTDIIVAAAGVTSTNLNRATFRVRDGYVIAAPTWIPSSHVAEHAIEEWARTYVAMEYQKACPRGIAGQSSIDGPRCARFIAETEEHWRGEVEALGLGR